MTFAEIDWTNGVALPLIMSFTVGVALAIYTGLIASRIFAFFQARYKAAIWVYALSDIFSEDGLGPHDFSIKLGKAVQPLMTEFRALGHENAVIQLGEIFSAYLGKIAQLLSVPMPKSQMPEFPSTLPPLIQMQFSAAMCHYYELRFAKDTACIASLKPNLWALVTPRPFPNYVSDSDRLHGLLVPRD